MNETQKPRSEALIRILHPSDFTRASLIAFAHALKIALQSHAELEIVHVEPHKIGSDKDVHWSEFPGVRATLARWRILPVDAEIDEVAKLGLRVKKILNSERDPLAAMTQYCETHPPDLLVLATHQEKGLSAGCTNPWPNRWRAARAR
jgi:nucleotide-binding universal stress UspA family protein